MICKKSCVVAKERFFFILEYRDFVVFSFLFDTVQNRRCKAFGTVAHLVPSNWFQPSGPSSSIEVPMLTDLVAFGFS